MCPTMQITNNVKANQSFQVNSSHGEVVTKLTNKNFIMTCHRRTPFKATPIELIHASLYYPFVA